MRADQAAAQTWDTDRPIEQTSHVIHDGAHTPRELEKRAKSYVADLLFGNFPEAVPNGRAKIVEIGSGLGWIMQGMNDYLTEKHRAPLSIIGLDIAPRMIAQAKHRMSPMKEPFDFLLYDGVTIPLSDSSLDLIYSVATLQHVPRPFVFNLFFEMKRLLMPSRFAIFHLLSTNVLREQEKHHTWRNEITNQITESTAHWHHFYTEQELKDVLSITGFSKVAVKQIGGALVSCVSR